MLEEIFTPDLEIVTARDVGVCDMVIKAIIPAFLSCMIKNEIPSYLDINSLKNQAQVPSEPRD